MPIAFVIGIALCAAYWFQGVRLSQRALEHLRDQKNPRWYTSLNNPELFDSAGEVHRRRALIFWRSGAVALVLYFAAAFMI